MATWGSSGSPSIRHNSRASGLGGGSSRRLASRRHSSNTNSGEAAAAGGEAAAADNEAGAAAAAGREALEASSKGEARTQGDGAPDAAPDDAAVAAAAAGAAPPPSKVLGWMLREERARVPPASCALLVAGLAGLVVTKVVSRSALACGSWQYWVLQCSIVPILAAVYLAARAHVLRKQRVLAAFRPTPPPADPDAPLSGLSAASGYLHFTRLNTLAIGGVCVVAGIIAGLVGLGGGIVLVSAGRRCPLLCPRLACQAGACRLRLLVPHGTSSSSSWQPALLLSTQNSASSRLPPCPPSVHRCR